MQHGKAHTYNNGCRCIACRAANAERGQRWRLANRKKLEEKFYDFPHGEANTYNNYGCRCEPCGTAFLEATHAQQRARGIDPSKEKKQMVMKFEKTGEHMKGKPPPVKIRDVEEVPCPKREGGNHEIVNLVSGAHRCKWCRVSWANLDAQVRQASTEAAAIRFAAGSRRRPVEDVAAP